MKILAKKIQFLSVSEAVQIVDIFRQNISVILPDIAIAFVFKSLAMNLKK